MKRIAVTLLAALLALTIAPGVAEAKKKNGPPPGTTTKQLQTWIEDYYAKRSCPPPECAMTFEWGRLQWVGTQKAGKTTKNLIYIARVDLLRTETTQPHEWAPGLIDPGGVEQTMYGWWEAGRRSVPGAYQGSNGLDYGKHLFVHRTDYGQWQFGWGHYFSILR